MENLARIFTKKRVQILRLIAGHDGLHIREIAEKTGASPASVHGAIKLFSEMGIVSGITVKNMKTVSVNRDNTIFKKIKSLLNIFDLQNKADFRELEKYGKVGVYGSFARGDDTEESDIDLWVYSNKKLDALKLRNVASGLEKHFGKEVKLLVLNDDKIKRLKEGDIEFYFRLKLTSVGEDIFG